MDAFMRSVGNGESAESTIACLHRSSTDIYQRHGELRSNPEELIEAFSSAKQDRISSREDTSSPREHKSTPLSPTVIPGSSQSIYSRESLTDHVVENSNSKNPRVAVSQTYDRWLKYFYAQQPVDGASNPVDFETDFESQALEYERETTGLKGLAGAGYSNSAQGLMLPPPLAQTAEQRRFWHPVLRIIAPSETVTPTSATSTARLDIRKQSSPTANQMDSVEIVRAFPVIPSDHHTKVQIEKIAYTVHRSVFPLYAVQPLCVIESSPLSRVILDYRNAARSYISDGNSALDVLGHDGIDVTLVFRNRDERDEFSTANWASEVNHCILSVFFPSPQSRKL